MVVASISTSRSARGAAAGGSMGVHLLVKRRSRDVVLRWWLVPRSNYVPLRTWVRTGAPRTSWHGGTSRLIAAACDPYGLPHQTAFAIVTAQSAICGSKAAATANRVDGRLFC
jgi:hypothetical protein